jgi:phage tail tape-measure protein
MTWEDEGQGALTGAGTGALTGAAIGSVVPGVGTAIGAGLGGGIGLIGGYFKGRGTRKGKEAVQRNKAALEQLSRQTYANRMEDLSRAMAYFAPVQQRMERLYGPGAGGPAWAPPPGRLY